ncbi:PTS glucose transporter subunit IIA [Clostridium tyrobutyricum]|uniref:PTS glucose transporter subunit IIA n=1 Tax=Clostridium tyrobutyricum TaxID=1519 RepID=UPI00073D4913|nr:PTS glucose transporter subunit IIA [Clostridium tyrobutyricum]
MFNLLKEKFGIKKEDKSVINNEFLVPVSGKVINLDDVKDEVFSQRMMGYGFAIDPEEGAVVKAGDLLLEVNIEEVKKRVPSIVVPVIFLKLNKRKFTFETRQVKAKDKDVIQIN